MGYLTYIFTLFFNIANSVKIPIPIATNNVVYLSIFNILIGCIVLGLIIWFISRLMNFEVNWAFGLLGKAQNEYVNNIPGKNTDKKSVKNKKG